MLDKARLGKFFKHSERVGHGTKTELARWAANFTRVRAKLRIAEVPAKDLTPTQSFLKVMVMGR